MDDIAEDIRVNFDSFSAELPVIIAQNIDQLRLSKHIVSSYARVAALNAIKMDLVKDGFPSGASHFFYEAHNDALLSHVNASFGSWRVALQCLRSVIENTLASIYFSEHPVEFLKWETGKYQISPRELREYVCDHPKIVPVVRELDLRNSLDAEYATLSKAVHGSNSLFRMTTTDGRTSIAKVGEPELGKWATREAYAIDLCAVLLSSIFQEHLEGAKMSNLRKSLGSCLKPKSRAALKKCFGISIPAPGK